MRLTSWLHRLTCPPRSVRGRHRGRRALRSNHRAIEQLEERCLLTLGPPSLQIVGAELADRSTPLDEIQFQFNEPVSGFGIEDVGLTRNGQTVAVAEFASLSTADDTNFVLSGLTAPTRVEGSYQLTISAAASGIVDQDEALPLQSDATASWTKQPAVHFGNAIGFHASGGFDSGNDVVTDADGNVYIVANFDGTVDVDPGPGELNLTSTSVGGDDGFVAKYTAGGELVWAKGIFGDSGHFLCC